MSDLASILQNPLAVVFGIFLVVRFVKDLFPSHDESSSPTAPAKPPPWGPIWRARRLTWLALVVTAVSGPWWSPRVAPLVTPLHIPEVWVLPGVLALISIQLGRFACPRCGRRFVSVRKKFIFGYHNFFTRHCLHCGLKAGTPGP